MRILFVGTRRGYGGTEAHLVECAAAMAAAGHHVAAVTWPDDRIDVELRRRKVPTFPARFRYASDVRGTRDLVHAARLTRPAWLISSFKQEYYSSAVVARLVGARLALFRHTDLPARRLSNFVTPRVADRFLVPSAFLRRHLIDLGMPADRVSVVHNPVDTEWFRPDAEDRAATRARLGYATTDTVCGFIGRVETVKGAPVLYEALRRAMHDSPAIRALWVGHGDWSRELAARTAADPLGHRHVITGDVADVRSLYRAMDIATLPSTRSETFGRVLIEAQACGVPVLGSDLGGIPEALEPGRTGFLLPPGDAAAWADAILRLADADTRPLARAARHFVTEHFSAPRIARDLETALQSASAG